MRQFFMICINAVLFVSVAGCHSSDDIPKITGTNLFSKQMISDRQDVRAALEIWVSDAPLEAGPVLLSEWRMSGNRDDSWGLDPVVRCAIAANLMVLDPKGYEEYYRYLVAQTEAKDNEIATVAVGGLGRAKGRDSIDLLFRYAKGSRSDLASSARKALLYRLVTADATFELKDEYEYIDSRLDEACAGKFANRMGDLCSTGLD